MKRNKGNFFRLGLFVTISVLLFILAVYYIGNNQNLFRQTFRLSSVFSNVSGLQPGNNVRFAGIKVGTVEKIVILSDSTLRVDMILEENVQPFIRRNALTSIGSDGLVGNMVVNINPGKGDLPPVEDGDTLESYSRLKTEDILNTLGKTNENLALLSNDLLDITQKINEGQGTVAMLLADTLLAQELRQSIANLNRTSAYLNQSSRQLRDFTNEIQSGRGLLATLIRDTTIKEKVDEMLWEIDTDLLVKVDSVMDDLRHSGTNIQSFSADLERFSQDLNNRKGLIGTVLHDSTAADDLKSTLDNLNQGSEMLNENLEAMREHFLFRRYFKKQEKEATKAAKERAAAEQAKSE